MNLISNLFFNNAVSDTGLALYIFNSFAMSINILNNKYLNNMVQSSTQTLGSVIFLNNPGNVSITNSIFDHNQGIYGTCIYYSETSKLFRKM